MKKPFFYLFIFLTYIFSSNCYSKINIVTTTTTLKSIVEAITGEKAIVSSIAHPAQDPHFIEAKPSFMLKLKKADLLISIGLELESAWLPALIRGSRNNNIIQGKIGYIDTSQFVEILENNEGSADRSQGDVHGLGNPHYLLDPIQTINVVKGLTKKLISISPENAKLFETNSDAFQSAINIKLLSWIERIKKSKIKGLMTYHKTFSYFFNRFNLSLLDVLEPKPGVPPGAKYINNLIKKMNSKSKTCILVESFFASSIPKSLKNKPNITTQVVLTEVNTQIKKSSYIYLIDQLVSAVEKCSAPTG